MEWPGNRVAASPSARRTGAGRAVRMATRRKPKNKHWKFLRKTFQQLALARAVVSSDSKSDDEEEDTILGRENGPVRDRRNSHESGPSRNLGNHVGVSEEHSSFHRYDQQQQKQSLLQRQLPNNLSATANPYLGGRRPSETSLDGSSKSTLSSSNHRNQDHEQQSLDSGFNSTGNQRGVPSALSLTTPTTDDRSTSTSTPVSFAAQRQRLLNQRRHAFLQQTATEEDFICKALGMDNRFGMCIRHPNQPIATNTQGLLMGTALYRVKTCLVCKSETQALGATGPDGNQLVGRHSPGMGNVIDQVQRLQRNKREWDRRTKLLAGSPGGANWDASDHSLKTSGTNTTGTIDEQLPTPTVALDAEAGTASLSLLDLESSPLSRQQHQPPGDDESKNMILSSASSLQYTEDEWAEQVRYRVMQVRSWEDRFAIRYHPVFCRYFKMVRLGVPVEAVKSSIEMDGYDPSIMDLDASQSLRSQINRLSPSALENLRTMGALDEISSREENGKDETELSIPGTVQRVLASLRHRRLNQVFAAATLWDEIKLRERLEEEEQNESMVDLVAVKPKSLPIIKSTPESEYHPADKGGGPLSKSDGQLRFQASKGLRTLRNHARGNPTEPANFGGHSDRKKPTEPANFGGHSERRRRTRGNDEKVRKSSPHPTSRQRIRSIAQQTRSFREDRAKNLDAMHEWRNLRPRSLRALPSTREDKHQSSKGHVPVGKHPDSATSKSDLNVKLSLESPVHNKTLNRGSKNQEWKHWTSSIDNTAEHRIEQRSEKKTTAHAIDHFPPEYGSPRLREKARNKVRSPPAVRNAMVLSVGPPAGSMIENSMTNERGVEKKQRASHDVQKPSSDKLVTSSKLLQSPAIPPFDTRMEALDSNPAIPERKASLPLVVDPRSHGQQMSALRILQTSQSSGPQNHSGDDVILTLKTVSNKRSDWTPQGQRKEHPLRASNKEIVDKQTQGNHDSSHMLRVAALKSKRNTGMGGLDASQRESRKRESLAFQNHPPVKDVILTDDGSVDYEKLQLEFELFLQRKPTLMNQEKALKTIPLNDVVIHRNQDGRAYGTTSVLTDDIGGSVGGTVETGGIEASAEDSLTSAATMYSFEKQSQNERVPGRIKPTNTLTLSKSLPVSVRYRGIQCSLQSGPSNLVSIGQLERLKGKLDLARASIEIKDKSIMEFKRELSRRDKTIERLEQRIQSLEDRSKATGRVLESATMQAKIDEAKKRQAALREKFMSPNRLQRNTTISASGMDFAALALSPADRSRRYKQSRLRNSRAGGDRTGKTSGARRSDLVDGSTVSSRSLDSGLPRSIVDWSSDDDGTLDTIETKKNEKPLKRPSEGDETAKKVILSLFDSWSARQFTQSDPQSPKSPSNRASGSAEASPRRGHRRADERVLGPVERKEWDAGEEKESLDKIQ